MSVDNDILNSDERQFLNDWEEVYKKGILTFWVLFYLSQSTHDANSLCELLISNDTSLNEHSIYRLLRRLYDVGMIDQSHTKGRNKYYQISPKGRRTLTAFTARNIAPLSQSLGD